MKTTLLLLLLSQSVWAAQVGGPVYFIPGATNAYPAILMSHSISNTGFYRPSSNVLGWAYNGQRIWESGLADEVARLVEFLAMPWEALTNQTRIQVGATQQVQRLPRFVATPVWMAPRMAEQVLQLTPSEYASHQVIYQKSAKTSNEWVRVPLEYGGIAVQPGHLTPFNHTIILDLSVPVETRVTAVGAPGGLESAPTNPVRHPAIVPPQTPGQHVPIVPPQTPGQHVPMWTTPLTNIPPHRSRIPQMPILPPTPMPR